MLTRMATLSDATQIREIYSYYILNTAVTYEYDVPTVSEIERRISDTMRKYPYLVAEENGRVVGYAYAGTFIGRKASDRCCEVSIYIDRDFRRCGVGRMLYSELERILISQNILNLNASIAVTEADDDPFLTRDSVRFHKQMGFNEVGAFSKCGYKFGRWYGLMWVEKHIGAHDSEPPEFTPIKYL